MNARAIAAVGAFSALAYVGSFLLLALPNATLSLLLVYLAGHLLGPRLGAAVGALSAVLISILNPYGLPLLPILAAQIVGYASIGAFGGLTAGFLLSLPPLSRIAGFATAGILTALLYQVPVSVVDAFLFGPFWERLALSAAFSLITLVSNVAFFVFLCPLLAKLKKVVMLRLN